MNKKQVEILKNELGLTIQDEIIEKFSLYEKLFVEYNSHTNLMSKNDISLLFEKHIFDSLAIVKSQNFKGKKILDVGTGGGFPSLILAICFKDIKIWGVDSVGKKINFINSCAKELGLKNIEGIAQRVENLEPLNVDIITSRAVGKIRQIWENSKHHFKKEGGKFIFYKANPKIYNEELKEIKQKPIEVVNYCLPTEEKHSRTLLVFNS